MRDFGLSVPAVLEVPEEDVYDAAAEVERGDTLTQRPNDEQMVALDRGMTTVTEAVLRRRDRRNRRDHAVFSSDRCQSRKEHGGGVHRYRSSSLGGQCLANFTFDFRSVVRYSDRRVDLLRHQVAVAKSGEVPGRILIRLVANLNT